MCGRCLWLGLVCLAGLLLVQAGSANNRSAAERGWEALTTRSFNPALIPVKTVDELWKRWGLTEKPADYARAFRDRYGFHPAPYENKGLPMGLKEGRGLLGKGLDNDCLLCHAGSIAGQTILGLGNASLDLQSFSEDVAAVTGLPVRLPFEVNLGRGVFEAGAVVAYLMQFRDADLNVRAPIKVPLPENLYEDVPAWWLLKRKRTMDHTGSINARTVRVNMAFLLSPLNSGEYIKKLEPVFADIHAYILSIPSPAYPFPVDGAQAARGHGLFKEHCAKCHGTYGPGGSYPNKIVPLDHIGTDPTLVRVYDVEGLKTWNKSWFAQPQRGDGITGHIEDHGGYQAPPLDGVWATAPYLHNGSVPTLYHLLNSQARPRIYTRTYRTEREDFDPVKVGWRFTVLEAPPDAKREPYERRKVCDTTRPGRGNGGHTFGDELTDEERMAVIEYLKTL